jgi:hypothetical protein
LKVFSLIVVAEECHISRIMVGNIRVKYYSDLPHPPAGQPRALLDRDPHQFVHRTISNPLESVTMTTMRFETSMSVHTSARELEREPYIMLFMKLIW